MNMATTGDLMNYDDYEVFPYRIRRNPERRRRAGIPS